VPLGPDRNFDAPSNRLRCERFVAQEH
jgi:hypothetical protein